MELLSPAGSREALTAAVQNGADAVYMGGGAFNARRSAANFDGAAMQEAIDYCHLHGVKAYITLNTLILDREMEEALCYAAFLHRAGADAAIVQDIGLAGILHRELPGLPLHASTQMGIHTPEGARLAKELGMERAVLSRETPLKEIESIRSMADIELEAFAHGALCMSFSGGCLFSSMAGERSGNRGTCAQPCRKRMKLGGRPGEEDYALSLGDLCMLERLGDLEAAGICCIKLEGRMKRPEYVAVVTRAYRLALDGADKQELARQRRRMLDMFDRGGGCTGYYYGQGASTGHCAVSLKPQELMAEAAASYAKEGRRLPVALHCRLKVGSPASLTMDCGDVSASAAGEVVQPANRPQNKERYAEQLKKLGDTPFAAESCLLDMEENAFLPMSAVNALRRECSTRLMDKLRFRREEINPALPSPVVQPARDTLITAIASTAEQAAAAFEAGAEEVALEPWQYAPGAFEPLQRYRREGAKLLLSLPAVTMSGAERHRIREIVQAGLVDGGIAANIGHLALLEGLPLRIAGSQMNALNIHTVAAYRAMGFDRVTLSLELTRPQLRDMCGAGTALSVYGRAQLMQLSHCPVKEAEGWRGCRGFAGELTDEAGRSFPLHNIAQAEGCLVRVLNCLPTDITDLFGQLPRPEAVQLAFYGEAPEAVAERIAAVRLALSGGSPMAPEGATRGHWARAVD